MFDFLLFLERLVLCVCLIDRFYIFWLGVVIVGCLVYVYLLGISWSSLGVLNEYVIVLLVFVFVCCF